MYQNSWPKGQIDHINGVRDDNRRENLREVDGFENHKNTKKNHNNTSGRTGISFNKRHQKWVAYIGGQNGSIFLGYFKDFEKAAAAREAAESEIGYHANHGRDGVRYVA